MSDGPHLDLSFLFQIFTELELPWPSPSICMIYIPLLIWYFSYNYALLMYVLYPLYVPLSGWKQIVLLYFSKVINYYFIRIVMIYLFHTDFRS